MHINPPQIDLGLSDLYALQAAKKAAEAKRAADVRRKLMKASAGIESESFELGGMFVDHRSSGGFQHEGDERGPHYFGDSSAPAAKPRKASDEAVARSLSVWA